MGTKIAGLALATSVAFGAGVVLTQPVEAQQDREDRMQQREERREQRMQQREERMAEREQRLQSGLEDGSITQERADEIRARWAEKSAHREERHAARSAQREERRAARAAHRDELAATLGTTAEQLKADRQAGASLAEIATAAGIDIEVIIDQIESHKTARINEALESGRIDQAKADEKLAGLRDRITARVLGEGR